MPICPVCGHDNTYGVLICVRCFTLLTTSVSDPEAPDTLATTIGNVPDELRAVRRVTRRFTPLVPNTIAIYVEESDTPLVIEVKDQILLGRYTVGGPSQPHVDLSPYGAYTKGVSRLHAVIRREAGSLFVEDLGSTNGSWLNNTRLIPFSARTLQAGDLVQLSQLQLTVYFS